MTELPITSRQNQRVKDAVRLRDRRQRDSQGRCLIDGLRELGRAIDAGIELVEVFVCEPLCRGDAAREVFAKLDKTATTVSKVTPEVFEKLAFGDRTEGVVGVATTPMKALTEITLGERPLVAVLEGVEKPGNLGAVLRSADGAGVAALVVADRRTDLYNPAAIRASLGTIFSIPVCEATSQETLAWLRACELPIVTSRTDGEVPYTEVDYSAGAAIVLGSETEGLSDIWSGSDITAIRLPMLGAADSLNVSATAAVIFYEALRQRRG